MKIGQVRKFDIKSEKGFTLMELIVVIGVIAILIAILLPQFNGYTDKANVVSAKSNAKTALTALMSYKTENDVANRPWVGLAARNAVGIALGGQSAADIANSKQITISVTTSTAPATIETVKGDLVLTTTLLISNGQLGETNCTGNLPRCNVLLNAGVVDTVG